MQRLSSIQAARKVSQASLSIFKSRRAQAKSADARQLHPTRPLKDRSPSRQRTSHLGGLPFPLRSQGDLAQGSLLLLLLALSSYLSVSASQSHRACSPSTNQHVLHVNNSNTALAVSPSLDGTYSLTHPQRSQRKTRRRESLGGIWNPFPVPTNTHLQLQLPPDSPSLRPRADIQDPAYNDVHPAITQQIFRSLRVAFGRTDLTPDTLRGVVLYHTEEPVRRRTSEPVAETRRLIKMAETMSPIGIANVRTVTYISARASPSTNNM
jgi:hypothetical protein